MAIHRDAAVFANSRKNVTTGHSGVKRVPMQVSDNAMIGATRIYQGGEMDRPLPLCCADVFFRKA
jgi:hypothetical protein